MLNLSELNQLIKVAIEKGCKDHKVLCLVYDKNIKAFDYLPISGLDITFSDELKEYIVEIY